MSNAALTGDASASALESLEKAHAGRLISAQAAASIQLWLTQPQYAEYMPLVRDHIYAAKWSELEDAFWTTIPFGTAGRRGRMYPIGTNAINDRTIGESAQGLADYVKSLSPPLPPGEGRGEGVCKPLLHAEILAFARDLRQKLTDAEQLLWSVLRDRRFGGFKFRRQHPVNSYYLDFYCHEARLAIELDVGQHNTAKGRLHDGGRTRSLEGSGIRVLRFWNHEILADTQNVLEAIWNALHEDTLTPALSHGERELVCAISYDTRHRSLHFAKLCAEIMVAAGFEVLMFDGFRATPELSFTVRDRSCACGIMISASHNPPADNAIKVFWSTGGQLKEPHDRGVIACVERVKQISRTPFAEAVTAGRVLFCQGEMDSRYQAAVLQQASTGPRDLKLLYSPLHGVGLTSVVPVLCADGFAQIEVYQPHATPDGDFPNVPGNVANPENPAVFDALIESAQASGADLVVASDPDADRIGCAAPLATAEGARWATLTGNQIGALLADLLLRRLRDSGQLTPEHYVIKTLVTSDMVCRIADHFGIRSAGDVLTGFKWIGSKIDELGSDKFVFGFEEAHGYLAGTYTRDKDAAVAAVLLAELAAECKSEGRTLHEQLDQLFVQYGCHLERTISHTLPGADGLAKMQQAMQRLRTRPPIELGQMKVAAVRDYLSQQVKKLDRNSASPITGVPPSDLLIFDLGPIGNRAAVRPSGTEPKLKFYLFAYESPASSTNLPETKRRLTERLDRLEGDVLAAANSD
jgi:phosphomannomutase/very-short-patch-repair endonuclease